ncbi:MAG: hypothetical protein CTY21_09445 [Methylomonas sp.]|nr:MAG: hypothetical protein CTY21_09445 [Methylomonas sp.]
MKTRCPSCGAIASLDVLMGHDAARDALQLAFKISVPLGGALVRYLALFRPRQHELSMVRVAKLLSELSPDMQSRKITRDGVAYDAPVEAWLYAFEQAAIARDDGRLKTPLRGHGWLYEVISNWRPDAGAMSAAETSTATARKASKTLGGIAALEQFKRG